MPICGTLSKRKHQCIKLLTYKSGPLPSGMIHVDEDDPVGELEPSFAHRDVTIKRGQDAEEFYDLQTEIGRGKFGTVYLCKEKATGLELAAKVVGVTRREDRRNAEREVDIMRQLRHPRLIQLYDAFDTGKLMCVVLELITGGELFERVIDDDFILTEKACTVFMRQICEGIEFVHQQNILHLDMKPENILCLTRTGNRIKIIDFGLARKFDPTKKLQILFGTPEFVAPEVVNFDQIGFGTDMWSIGVICYVLLSGLSPFMGETDVETMANVTIAKYDFDDEAFNDISEDAKDFIKKLLVKDKQSRMTAGQCITHKWLLRRPPPEKKMDLQAPIIIASKQPDELDVTKDNLRMFVERWSEHPNSPYLFDVTNHEITPCVSLNNCLERTASQQSLGGCSPSPCGSLNSSPDSVTESEEILYRNDNNTLHPEGEKRSSYNSLSLERRASDSSCFVNKKADITLRVNLAEEIKKLSDRLFMLSSINTDLENNSADNKNSEVNQEVNNVTEKIPNGFALTSSVKTGSTSNRGLNHTNSNSVVKTSLSKTKDGEKSTTSYKLVSNTVKKSPTNGFQRQSSSSSSSTMVTTSTLNGNNERSSRLNGHNNSISKSSSSAVFSSTKFDDSDNTMDSNIPWRRKFKVNNSSRDVPMSPTEKRSMFGNEFNRRRDRIDNFANNVNCNGESSSTSRPRVFYKKTDENGEPKNNANNTKDLLLHLLDQWDESQCEKNNNSNYNHSGRHKSVSMEWSEAEKVASKSMNTINTFFRKQSSISSSVKKKQEALASNGYK